jgi:hypothetical protein
VIDFKGSGFKSRKMLMTYAVLVLGTAGFVVTGVWPALATTFPEFCTFLIGASGVYIGGNTITKWVASQAAKTAIESGRPE